MPQASQEVLDAWPGDDSDALSLLKENFGLTTGGVFYRKDSTRQPTQREFAALDYLIQEWDYAYAP